MEELAKEAEEAAQKGEQTMNVYKIRRRRRSRMSKITKLICGKYSDSRNAPIRDKQGQLLTSEKDQEARWVEHFKEVLNRPAPEVEPDVPEAQEDLSVDTEPPEKEEIIAAINSLKNHKAPGRGFHTLVYLPEAVPVYAVEGLGKIYKVHVERVASSVLCSMIFEELPYADRFTYLGSIISRDGNPKPSQQGQKLAKHDE